MKNQLSTEERTQVFPDDLYLSTHLLDHLHILTTDIRAHQRACIPHHKQHTDTILHFLMLDTHSLPVWTCPTGTSHPTSRSVHIYRNTEDQCLVLFEHIKVFLTLFLSFHRWESAGLRSGHPGMHESQLFVFSNWWLPALMSFCCLIYKHLKCSRYK